jgi:biotin transporter BioY
MAHDVFISYSSADKPTADAVCATLENRGVRCWIAPRDVLPGMDWAGAIIDAISASRIMVLVYSARANDSQQIKREVERAVNRGMPIIPFRIENVPMSKTLEYFISTPHWLDALTQPLQQHLDRLADTTALILEQEGVTLAAPAPGHSTASGSRPIRPITSSQDIVSGARRWMTGGTESSTLAQVFVPRSDTFANAILIGASVIGMAILAQIKFGPIWLLPLAALFVGVILGSQRGGLAAMIFIVLGVVGIPVFGGGRSAWTPVEFRAPYAQLALGFLLGLAAATFVVGWLAERRAWDRRLQTAGLLALVGVLIMYVPGFGWVQLVALFQRQTNAQIGILPSVPMLVLTVAILAVVLPQAWRWVAERQQPKPVLEPTVLEPEPEAQVLGHSETTAAGSVSVDPASPDEARDGSEEERAIWRR